ncbi:hypothetical protein ASPBRDRAFT_47308 [Aspergillus brasiliensis CBS 101740]|uniref:Zn(2)-C6 fungal-type domain-containing protein n=1 Tax=Aspergillus brasiliensis (strain CBS 101740 / IMI 381727 / IBT 21946) TaxID=767769 RepID=A0A1L9U7Z6_ASPBC|nr:hypothetical protein ASPBRDRAFT_47308 [Aspergillus brasiliensis CBS 101740]
MTTFNTRDASDRGRQAGPSNRGSCLVCRKRRIRCPRNKPVCERCWNDNKKCVYGQNFRWEEESIMLGIAHGRSRGTSQFSQKEPWKILVVERKNFQFLNFGINDMDISRGLSYSTVSSDGCLSQNSVPPSLSPMPGIWPEFSNKLFELYCEQVSQSMILINDCWNPFRRLVLPLAFQNPIILAMVFALGALSLAQAGQKKLHSIALHYKIHSIRMLRHALLHSTSIMSDSNMIAILMLSVFEASESEDSTWSIHLCAVFDMINTSSKKEMSSFSPEVLRFVSRFFIVKEAFWGTACGKRGKVKTFPIARTTVIDPHLGCSLELIDIISEITDLSMQSSQFNLSSYSQVSSPPEDLTHKFNLWSEKKEIIRHRLEHLTQHISSTTLPETQSRFSAGPQHHEQCVAPGWLEKMLQQTSSLIHVSVRLYFLVCLCTSSPDHPNVQNLLQEAIALLKSPSLYSVHPMLVWPIFICAIYAVDDADRVFFLDKFDALQTHCHVHLAARALKRCRNIVESVWKQRDIRRQLGFEDEWMKVVQPMILGLSF